MIVQLTGLSGSGKTTISKLTKANLIKLNCKVEVIDGDQYRNSICKDLGYSKKDRMINIERLAIICKILSKQDIIAILCAINPYEKVRKKISRYNKDVITVWIKCDVRTLIKRDTKGLYKRALLPASHPLKLTNLTGINDPYEIPINPDLIINTDILTEVESADELSSFILKKLKAKHL